jgi:hypothetical protein
MIGLLFASGASSSSSSPSSSHGNHATKWHLVTRLLGLPQELILTPLDALDEPPSLIQLRKVVAERLPRVELAELVLEVALRTGFTEAFTHLTDRSARTADFA